jgi:hypothetical protein
VAEDKLYIKCERKTSSGKRMVEDSESEVQAANSVLLSCDDVSLACAVPSCIPEVETTCMTAINFYSICGLQER